MPNGGMIMNKGIITKISAVSVALAMSSVILMSAAGGNVRAYSNIQNDDGNITLTGDCMIDVPLTSAFQDIKSFDMNGCKLTYIGSSALFSLSDETFTIKDSSEEKTGEIISQIGATVVDARSDDSKATVKIESGTIRGSGSRGNSAILMGKGDSFFLNGGTICDFYADEGAALCLESTYSEMNGGTISNCHATERGGAVLSMNVSADNYIVPFRMLGGTITDCSAKNGGAIFSDNYLAIGGSAVLNYNSASENGGAVYSANHGDRTILLLGGTASIRFNTCLGDGGGIYCEVTNENDILSVSGLAVIRDNYDVSESADDNDNLYFSQRSTLWTYEDIDEGCYIGFYYPNMSDGDEVVTAYSLGGIDIGSGSGMSIPNDADYPVCLFPDDDSFYVSKEYENGAPSYYIREGSGFTITRVKCYLENGAAGMIFLVSVPEDIDPADVTGLFSIGSGSDKKSFEVANSGQRSSNGEVAFVCPVNCTDFTKPISLEVAAYGNVVKGASISGITVKNYARVLYENPGQYSASITKEFIAALMIYGSAAQTYFNINTDNLPDDFVDSHYKQNTQMVDVSSNLFGSECYSLTENDGSPIHYYGTSMIFKSEVSLKFYFTYDEGTDLSKVKIRIGDTTFTPTRSGNYLYVKLCDINLGSLADQIEVAAVYDGTDVSNLTYSPYSYVVRITGKTVDPNMAYLCKALYMYYHICLNFYH